LAGTGIRRNPPDSGRIWSKYRNSCPTGIPAKKSCKSEKNRNSCDPLQNHVTVKNSSGKCSKKKKSSGFLAGKVFGSKN
jgi:hypothetical protein